jgi:hypothetical protein
VLEQYQIYSRLGSGINTHTYYRQKPTALGSFVEAEADMTISVNKFPDSGTRWSTTQDMAGSLFGKLDLLDWDRPTEAKWQAAPSKGREGGRRLFQEINLPSLCNLSISDNHLPAGS